MPALAHKLARLIRALHDTLRLIGVPDDGFTSCQGKVCEFNVLPEHVQRAAAFAAGSNQFRQEWKPPLYKVGCGPSQSAVVLQQVCVLSKPQPKDCVAFMGARREDHKQCL